ncbi:MAG TPA: response regulator [Candidatus Nitrosotenuis sp.]|jgi:DNA-binding NarL/FixJ family response regulator
MPRAIVVDDDRDTVDVFCEYLRLIDVDVVGWGYNGKDAAELYEKHRPDIAFVDLSMPEHDGFFALEGIKGLDPGARVVILTANYTDDIVRKLEQLKPHKILKKPFGTEQVYEIINEIRQSIVMV